MSFSYSALLTLSQVWKGPERLCHHLIILQTRDLRPTVDHHHPLSYQGESGTQNSHSCLPTLLLWTWSHGPSLHPSIGINGETLKKKKKNSSSYGTTWNHVVSWSSERSSPNHTKLIKDPRVPRRGRSLLMPGHPRDPQQLQGTICLPWGLLVWISVSY